MDFQFGSKIDFQKITTIKNFIFSRYESHFETFNFNFSDSKLNYFHYKPTEQKDKFKIYVNFIF